MLNSIFTVYKAIVGQLSSVGLLTCVLYVIITNIINQDLHSVVNIFLLLSLMHISFA